MPPTTRKADGRLRSVVWLLVPVALGLVIALGYYLIFYVRAREQYFTERAFRSLAVLSEQVEGVIAGLDSAIRNAAATEKPWDTIELVPHLEYASCAELPHDCPRGPGMSMCVGWTGADSSETSSARLSSEAALRINPSLRRSARLYFSYEPLAAESTAPPSPPTGGVAPATGRSRRKLGAHSEAAVRARAGSSTAPPTPTATPTCALTPSPTLRNEPLCASADLSELLKPLLGSSAFDDFDVFLASDEGSILFERGRSGLRLAHLEAGGKGSGGNRDVFGAPYRVKITR